MTNLIGLDDVTTGINAFDPGANGVAVGQTGWINLLDTTYTGVGVEADLELYPIDGLDLFANANLMQVLEQTEGQEQVREGSASQLKLNGGFSYRTDYRTDLSASVHYLSGQTWRLREFNPDNLQIINNELSIPDRLILSARVAVRPLENEDFEIAATAWNITELLKELAGDDSGFLEHPQGQPVGGRAFATLSYRF